MWLFADYCVIYWKITDSSDIDKLQTDLNRLGECAIENEINIYPEKSFFFINTVISNQKTFNTSFPMS